jgi:hypothetical protein
MTASRPERTDRFGIAARAVGALLLLWAGVVIGVSLLAAPAKFAAPSLTLPVAMEVGRHEFGVLNLVEVGLAVVTLALAFLIRLPRATWLGLGLAAAIVALEGLWLLPVLDARAEMIMEGQTPPAAPWHTIYVVLEVTKLLALLGAGWLALARLR